MSQKPADLTAELKSQVYLEARATTAVVLRQNVRVLDRSEGRWLTGSLAVDRQVVCFVCLPPLVAIVLVIE